MASLLTALCALSTASTAQSSGIASVIVRVQERDGVAVTDARVSLDGHGAAATTRGDGSYVLSDVAFGRYTLRVLRIGYSPFVETGLVVHRDITRDVVLDRRPVPLSAVVIAPGSYSGFDVQAPSLQVLSREDLLTRPQLAEDLFRSLNRVPGFSGSDYSAKLRVRNSAPDEVLVLLDGLELVEPFHMKDFDGALTIVDQDAIGNVELSAGGFGARYGTRGAGVVQLSSVTPEGGKTRGSVGLSLSNVRLRGEGSFSSGKGRWLVSARRGYLDIVFKLIGETEAPNPSYYDVLAKVQRSLGSRHIGSLNALVANDALKFSVDEGVTNARGGYGNAYLWGTVRSQWSESLHSTTLASFSRLSWKRDGQEAEFLGALPTVRAGFGDRRDLTLLGIKQDWTWDVGSRGSVLFGAEGRQEDANYDYSQFQVRRARINQGAVVLDSLAWRLVRTVAGYRQSAYAALRLRPLNVVTAEIGVRGDRHSWTRERTVTPRLNVRWDVQPRTAFRAAWGTYAQAQGLQDLSVVDGDSAFAPAERSEQRVIGVEHRAIGGWTARVEVFQRRIRDPRPRWFSADGELDPFPEGQDDRVRLAPDSSRVSGAELVATYDAGGRVSASAWYARTTGRSWFGGQSTARPNEEPHAGAIDVAIRTRRGWTWAVAWTMRSGWPAMLATFVADSVAPGQVSIRRIRPTQFFTSRQEGYRRLDVRVSRRFLLRRGAVEAYAEVFNLLDRQNQRGWSYDVSVRDGRLTTLPSAENSIGRLPTMGFRWVF